MIHRLTTMIAMSLVVTLGTGGFSVAQDDNTEVVGFSIAKKDAGNAYGQSYVPGTQAGLQVYLRVSLPKNTILNVDGEKTSLKVTDSANEELEADENSSMSFMSSVSDDKHAAIVPVQCTGFPSSGSTSLSISGEAVLNCGADPKSETVDVAIKADGELTLGPVKAKVSQLGDGFEPETKRLDLESKNSFDQLESLVFLDSKGKEIETSPAGSGSFGFGDDMTYSKSFQFKGTAESIAKAKVSYFQKMEAIKVPVNVQFGLGLGK